MRIALVGEFSGLHSELARGLGQLGHEAHVYSSGDGFKAFKAHYHWGPVGSGYISLATYLLSQQPKLLNQILNDYDAVQFINPDIIASPNHFRKSYLSNILSPLKLTSAKKILAVAGCDAKVRPHMEALESSPCSGCLADSGLSVCQYREDGKVFQSALVENLVDIIIPFGSSTYAASYSHTTKNRLPVMFPIDTDGVDFRPNAIVDGRITVLHGLNRPGFKGTNKIRAVFSKLDERYPNTFRFLSPNRLPFVEYMNLLYDANVVVDQLHGDALAMNALYSMAAGRVVMACYETGTKLGGVDLTNCPAISVTDEMSLEQSLLKLAEWSVDDFLRSGENGRYFVESHCKADKVAADWLRAIGERLP